MGAYHAFLHRQSPWVTRDVVVALRCAQTWAKPKPPYVCTHVSPACHDASAARCFAMLACGPHGRPASKSSAALSTIKLAWFRGRRPAGRSVVSARHASTRKNTRHAKTKPKRAARTASTAMCASAMGNCTPWLAPMGRPTTRRSGCRSAAIDHKGCPRCRAFVPYRGCVPEHGVTYIAYGPKTERLEAYSDA